MNDPIEALIAAGRLERLEAPDDEIAGLWANALKAERFIEERGLTQAEAAALMGVSQPRISDLVRGRVEQFTIDSLINMLTSAGVPVEVRAAGGPGGVRP